MGINFCMAGVPYWTHDIGGWLWEKDLYPECAQDPAFAELHTRWFQLGVFTPMCRIHGSWSPREIYRFPEPFYSAHVQFLELRARMLPYIYSLAWRITNEGYTLMRGLAMDFPNDPKVHAITGQYMFGPAFLVCPVLDPILYPAPEYGEEAEQRMNRSGVVEVYLPQGAEWYDFWSGEKFSGGQTLRVDAAIDRMPLFVRAGSIVPLGPVKDYAEATSPDALEIRVYPGQDADFTLYDDDGTSYAYEQGHYETRALHWNERLQQLQGTVPSDTVQVCTSTASD
jgi:alpha-D-xyloside xylohydrolase